MVKHMVRIWLLIVVTDIVSVVTVHAQRVYEAGFEAETELMLFVTNQESEADLVVFMTQYQSDARRDLCDGTWYRTPFSSQADFIYGETTYRSQADLIISYTPYRSEAMVSDRACDLIRSVAERSESGRAADY